MEIALIHDNSLVLGPMGINTRMINSELENLELSEIVTSQSYLDLPIHFSDGITHLVVAEKEIPNFNPKYYNVGNFVWEIINEDDIPIKVKFTYPILPKSLEEVKYAQKQILKSLRKQKEEKYISININNQIIEVSTSREERLLLSSKITSYSDPCNYKFGNVWIQVTLEQLQYIINIIDKEIQKNFDWEFEKINQIDACSSLEEVYSISLNEEIPNKIDNTQT